MTIILHKNVFVFPNAIDPNDPQFSEKTESSDKIRVGWLGGSSHLHDLKLLDGMVSKLKPVQDTLDGLSGIFVFTLIIGCVGLLIGIIIGWDKYYKQYRYLMLLALIPL